MAGERCDAKEADDSQEPDEACTTLRIEGRVGHMIARDAGAARITTVARIVAQLDECIRINDAPQVTLVLRRCAAPLKMSCLVWIASSHPLERLLSACRRTAPRNCRANAAIVCAKTSFHELKAGAVSTQALFLPGAFVF